MKKQNIILTPTQYSYSPLEKVKISGIKGLKLIVLDGNGDEYIRFEKLSSNEVDFFCGATAGIQTILIYDNEILLKRIKIRVIVKTEIIDSKKKFSRLLDNLFLTMCRSCGGDGAQFIQVNGKIYNYFIRWLRDHTHTLKGMKYFYPLIKQGLEIYADTQRKDGMLFERIAPKKKDVQGWRDYTFKEGNFIKTVYSNDNKTGIPYTLQRIPVENDVEYLFIECLYYTWKATGDTLWMSKYLDHCIKAVHYSTTNKFRWSKKYGLLKRAYTIDTWDFIHSDDGKYTLGDNCFDKNRTVFGIMFGDNTGMAMSCKYLSEMLEYVGRKKEAKKYKNLSKKLLANLEKISWNGKFYKHHVSEDPSFKRDVGNTNENEQVTLSNAYSINRDIGLDKSIAIINTYKNIRKNMPKNSPGEFYNCYPPFEKGFGEHNSIWQYMNGGVSTIVAGELARGAFLCGEEEYAIDIMNRILNLADKYNGHLHVCFNGNPQKKAPDRNFDCLDLADFANVSTKWRKEAGWGEKGNDLSNLPTGRKTFLEIPFLLREKGIGLSEFRSGYHKEISLPLEKKFSSLYLLHTFSGHGTIIAELTLYYSDNTSESVYIQNKKNIGNWFMPDSEEIAHMCHEPKLEKGWPEYQIAWRGSSGKFDNVGIYIWGLDNPHPEKEVSKISFSIMKNNTAYLVSGITLSDKPVWFQQSELSFGIPDAWGAAAIVYSLIEGLSGVTDKGIAFDNVEISPRWGFFEEKKVKVSVTYPASNGYVTYLWEKNLDEEKLIFTTSAEKSLIRLPLTNKKHKNLFVNGKPVKFNIIKINEKLYIEANIYKKGVHKLVLSP
ncbi:MAG TPA: hypothetical protein PLN24_04155 [Victivallales bacterium]|nr:hypothetical protein [Victivallales bacterium]HPO89526.1 hypothetical protein [Victivallales bacterium]